VSNSPYIVAATAENFAKTVLEQSQQVPVLVDFWAVWCQPCQMLMPVLERLADEYQGKFMVAKVNSDEQQKLAMQYGVRSIPSLKLFRNGAVVDEMVGVQPEAALRAMIDRYIERPSDRLRAQAMTLHTRGDSAGALKLLQKAQESDPGDYQIHEDIALVLIDTGEYQQAHELLRGLPANIQAEASVGDLMARLEFGLIVEQAPDIELLNDMLAQDPLDHQARYQLSARQVLNGEYQAAMDNLLEIMRKDRNFQDDGARKTLLTIFKLLGNDNPLAAQYRRKVAMLLL
jgi:putative thioredoxin